jgi:co-chaperonin GroES (HSP10)
VRRGIVVECGPGDKLKRGDRAPMNVKPGDQVLYQRAPANVVSFDGVEYDLLHEEQHILAVLEQ